ncbi:hypothetical protein JKF63_07774 [Porcisia hertigi]|uniref:Uncharacterized protein n=1 Tax=Porcisia hertigi TaxID=2761500 RepID=A0A837A9S7_9TRYP|nr:hypothetical protein JKF63_07774 [Porcisia hertigi]
MSTHTQFAGRLEALFITELRRQGVGDTEAWAKKLQTYCSYAPATCAADDSSDTRDCQRATPSTVLVIDMTNLTLGDKPVVALCESLLKMEGMSFRPDPAVVSELQVIWRRCGLTDRVLRHLELLLLGCQRLTLLDVSANALSIEGQAGLLHAAAEVSCDVVLTEDARATHSSVRAREASGPSSLRSTSFPPKLAQPERHHRRCGAGVTASEGASVASRGLTQLHLRGGQHMNHSSRGTRWQASSLSKDAAALHPPRHRSPSLGGASASASASPSLRSYASGSAESLQKRREELFGPSATASIKVVPTAPEAAAGNALAATEGGNIKNGKLGGATTTTTTGRERDDFEAARPTARSPARTSPAEEANSGGGGGHSPFAAASGRSPSPHAIEPTEAETRLSTHRASGAHAAPTPHATSVASREPFVDLNDQIDLTANLSPVLDSVLDLSALMTCDGALLQAHMFGGACTVWDVLDAYESAAEQQLRGSASQSGESSVDAVTKAKLPAALLGRTAYNAITVLNLSRNHLTTLCALPATLLRLDVSVNKLTELSGLQGCKMLTVLNARRNCLRFIGGLESNLSVAHLFLGHNNITAVEGVAHLVLLQTLDLTFNRLCTQTSMRMLSLCSALRHLMLRGNPIMKTGKQGFMAVLRNLCPTLLVVDEHLLGNSSLADRALAKRNWSRQPNMINNTQPYARAETLRGGNNVGASSSLMLHAGMASNHTFVDGSTMSSFAFTSRRRDGNRPTPFAAGDDDVLDERSMNLLHMLTRGVTTPTGYGVSARSQHAAQQLAQTRKEQKAQAQAERKQRLTANGRPLRGAVVKHLAEESRKYLEDTIVRRMTTVQQQQLLMSHGVAALPCAGGSDSDTAGATASDSKTRPGAGKRNTYGGVAHPELAGNPLADVMGYTAASPEKRRCASMEDDVQNKTDAELLRRYKPRTQRLRRAQSAKPQPLMAAGTSAGLSTEHQEASRRRVMITGRSPSPAASRAVASTSTAELTRGHSARRTHRADNEADLVAQYVGHTRQSRLGNAARSDSGSYAALHIAEHRQAPVLDDTEFECSPISKDPQGPLATSLNTTASILHDNAHLQRLTPPSRSAYSRSPPPAKKRVQSPTAQAHRHPPTPQDYRDPTEVEMTAVYLGSRSPSRSSRGDGRGNRNPEQKWQLQHYQRTPPRTNAPGLRSPSAPGPNSVTAAASRVAHSGNLGGSAFCSVAPPPPSSSAQTRSPSMRPLHIDDAQRSRVMKWTQQLHDDTNALQDALQTLVDLLVAQRQHNMPLPESSRELPPTYLQERSRCVQILHDSGMLQDTYVPMDVVVYYGLSKAELEGKTDRSMQVVAHRDGSTETGKRSWSREVAERSDVLRHIHLMGDAKTCLRYVALLVGDGREKLLQQYVDQLKESLRSDA